jgi:CRISPR/Cas system-associated exonuclease Cas4 (RecB family)
VHAAVEGYHRYGTDPVDVHTELAQEARARTENAPQFVKDNLEVDILVGTNCCMAYRRWMYTEDPYKDWEIIGIERTVETPLLDGRVILRGKIDLLLKGTGPNEGQILLDDLKTVASTRVDAAQNHVLRTYQHAVYASTLEAQDGIAVTKARYVHLKKVRDLSRAAEPVIVTTVPVMRRTTKTSMEYVTRILAEMEVLIQKDVPSSWYPYPQDSCSWCDYRNPCLLATEGRGAEGRALADKYQHGKRLARYGVTA